jgi:hypothetical protein
MGVKFNPFTGNLDLIDTTAAAGLDGQVQFNNSGLLDGSADFTWDDTGKVLDVGGDINLDDGGANQTTLQLVTPTAARTITFPDATGTVGLVAGSTGQLVFNLDGAYSGGPLYDNTKGTLGYNTGGAVTQETSKSTGVTLNGASGRITLNAAALDTATTVSFTLTNTSITANDLLLLNQARIDSSGRLLVGTSTNTGDSLFQVNGNRIRIATAKTPASAADTGAQGEISWDADYIYVCTATNTWKRAALSTW